MSTTAPPPPTRDDVQAARQRLGARVRRTPVISDSRWRFKLEMTQHTGSFKARGALNSLLGADIPPAGVVAASGGNHGAAVAWAARELHQRATIFIPEVTSEAKRALLASYGADVVVAGAVYADVLEAARQFQSDTGAVSVHAYNDPSTVTGAATMAAEFVEQCPEIDAVIVACGGGGLAAGTAISLNDGQGRALFLVETTTTAAYHDAVQAGRPVQVEVSGLCADALGAPEVGSLPWQVLSQAAATPVLVSDEQVAAAQLDLWQRHRLVAEPSGAASWAAATSGALDMVDGPVGVVLCGANVSQLPA